MQRVYQLYVLKCHRWIKRINIYLAALIKLHEIERPMSDQVLSKWGFLAVTTGICVFMCFHCSYLRNIAQWGKIDWQSMETVSSWCPTVQQATQHSATLGIPHFPKKPTDHRCGQYGTKFKCSVSPTKMDAWKHYGWTVTEAKCVHVRLDDCSSILFRWNQCIMSILFQQQSLLLRTTVPMDKNDAVYSASPDDQHFWRSCSCLSRSSTAIRRLPSCSTERFS